MRDNSLSLRSNLKRPESKCALLYAGKLGVDAMILHSRAPFADGDTSSINEFGIGLSYPELAFSNQDYRVCVNGVRFGNGAQKHLNPKLQGISWIPMHRRIVDRFAIGQGLAGSLHFVTGLARAYPVDEPFFHEHI